MGLGEVTQERELGIQYNINSRKGLKMDALNTFEGFTFWNLLRYLSLYSVRSETVLTRM